MAVQLSMWHQRPCETPATERRAGGLATDVHAVFPCSVSRRRLHLEGVQQSGLHGRLSGLPSQYYYAPGGQRYRSKNEVAKTLGIDLPSRAPKPDTGEDGSKVSKVCITTVGVISLHPATAC